MPQGKNPNRLYDYVLECDREGEEEFRTTWKLKKCSLESYYAAQDSIIEMVLTESGETIQRIKSGSRERDTLLAGVIGWTNFKDDEGREIPYVEKSKLNSLAYLEADDRRELANIILEGSFLTEEEKKS